LDYILNNFDCNHFKIKDVIYNPIEETFLQRNPANENNTILFIGKITETKGCYSLLKAFNNISLRHPNWRLRLVGNGNIQEAQSYIWDEKAVEDRPVKENDHLMDSMRYFVHTMRLVRPEDNYRPIFERRL
jgi:glycosyltransferase involved in cell wall biosynthesis